jgi:P-type E1-E2 ATPase
MLQISIPGMGDLKLTDLMIDYNGTIAVDGYLIKGVAERLAELSSQFKIHIVTGDTHGTAKSQLANINCELTIVPPENQTFAKLHYLELLPLQATVAIGNGRNDSKMLKDAVIGIAVIGEEGAAVDSINAADIVVTNILNAFALLSSPRRLISTLRQ